MLLITPCVNASTLEPITNGYIYYSPTTLSWSTKADKNSIKITKKDNKYYIDNKFAFEIDSQYNFIKDRQYVAVNNNNLKFYTAIFKKGKFLPATLHPDLVQSLFKDIKVLPVSSFENGLTTVYRTPFQTEQFLIVNDTSMDFTDYRYSPTSIQHSPIKGIFIARKVGAIHFVKIDDVYKKYPILTVKIKNDKEKYNNPQPVKIIKYKY